MKTFTCGSVVPGCTAAFAGETEEDILEQIARHAREEHGMTEIPEELVEQILTQLR